MTVLNADQYSQEELLQRLNSADEREIEVINLCGQRYIGCGWQQKKSLILKGTAGNNLGAFAAGPEIMLYGNCQEGVANTMSEGRIIVHGRAGDIAGYAMRGGELFIRDDAGYRLGIHMKAYQDKKPLIVVGGSTGAFTGEYMAGGTIVILGLNRDQELVGKYCGTGLYAGSIYLRGDYPLKNLAPSVEAQVMEPDRLGELEQALEDFALYFGYSLNFIRQEPFTRLTRKSDRPFASLYTGFVS
jgi:glutamate synthase domain-containing protein 3